MCSYAVGYQAPSPTFVLTQFATAARVIAKATEVAVTPGVHVTMHVTSRPEVADGVAVTTPPAAIAKVKLAFTGMAAPILSRTVVSQVPASMP